MSRPSFQTPRLLSMAALMPAHCTPAIRLMITVLVYGAEKPSDDILPCNKSMDIIIISRSVGLNHQLICNPLFGQVIKLICKPKRAETTRRAWMMNQMAHARQLPMMRTSPRTAEWPAAAAGTAEAVCSAKRQWMGDAQILSSGPL
jgi:hypothetical protein